MASHSVQWPFRREQDRQTYRQTEGPRAVMSIARGGVTEYFSDAAAASVKVFSDSTYCVRYYRASFLPPKAVITIAIRLRSDYDPTTT